MAHAIRCGGTRTKSAIHTIALLAGPILSYYHAMHSFAFAFAFAFVSHRHGHGHGHGHGPEIRRVFPLVPSPTMSISSSTDGYANEQPTFDQIIDTATYVQTKLEDYNSLLEMDDGEEDVQQILEMQQLLLDDLHSIAFTLVSQDFSDDDEDNAVAANQRAVELIRYSLDNNNFENTQQHDPNTVALLRERLSAALRNIHKLNESAHELYQVIELLERGELEQQEIKTTLCYLYLDLGYLIEEIRPLPGAGYDYPETTSVRIPTVIFQRGNKKRNQMDKINDVELSALDCYKRAIDLDDQCGLAHKRFADAFAILDRNDEALREFELAAKYMPEDVCCATHLYFAAQNNGHLLEKKQALPLSHHNIVAKQLEELCVNPKQLELKANGEIENIAKLFETNGALVIPEMLNAQDVELLSGLVDGLVVESSRGLAVTDFTDETKAAKHRIHMSLPLDRKEIPSISDLLKRLYPLLSFILQSEQKALPLIGSGFMQTYPGAKGQELHKDVHHYDRHSPFQGMPDSTIHGQPRCISIQVQLTDTTAIALAKKSLKRGSLELLPGSHRPDTTAGAPATIQRALNNPTDKTGVIAVDVPPGTVTIYSSRLWHRGGPNNKNSASSNCPRTFCFFTVTEANLDKAPPGLIHTMEMKDVGRWKISGADGLLQVN